MGEQEQQEQEEQQPHGESLLADGSAQLQGNCSPHALQEARVSNIGSQGIQK